MTPGPANDRRGEGRRATAMTPAPANVPRAERVVPPAPANGGRPRVVVVGGGFAGLSAVRALAGAPVDVLLLDRNPYSTFQPLLYQVATGGLNPGDVTYALRAAASRIPNLRFRRLAVTGVDSAGGQVHTDAGALGYDYLVLACGVGANFFGVPGAAEHARTIYSRDAAIGVRDTLFARVEAVSQGRPGAVEPVMVVVGAGATGVEMAGTLAELRNVAIPRLYPEVARERVRVVVVEMGDEVLAPFSPRLRRYAADELVRRGVELRLGTRVSEVHPDAVVLGDGEVLPAAVTIWASGVKVRDEVASWGLPQGRGGRVQVDADLRVAGHPEIFVVGDVAATEHDPLPQLAQPAMQGGEHAARQIRRLVAGETTEPMRYRDKGTMATIGRSDAVLQLPNGFTLRGFLAWLGWLGLHIVMLEGGRNRLATLTNLSVRYASWPSSINIIMGDPPR